MMQITVVYSPAPREVHEWAVVLPSGATVAHALQASPLCTAFPGLDLGSAAVGVWGRAANAGQVLQERDRVEVYRPLKVDPKTARRERFRSQGVRAAGLFAKKNAGTKAGD
jgi:putative ubiquitin-RnfH superfamily antitoxin RatB of RatAB toxin-antitoxin module